MLCRKCKIRSTREISLSVSPVEPGIPLMPGNPVSPVNPRMPVGPTGPVQPVSPEFPRGPVAPVQCTSTAESQLKNSRHTVNLRNRKVSSESKCNNSLNWYLIINTVFVYLCDCLCCLRWRIKVLIKQMKSSKMCTGWNTATANIFDTQRRVASTSYSLGTSNKTTNTFPKLI